MRQVSAKQIGFLILVAGVFIWAAMVTARELTVINSPLTPGALSVMQFSIIDKIYDGVELLEKSEPLRYETRNMRQKNGKLIKTGELIRKQVALAILDKNTGEIFEKRVWVEEQDIQNYKKTGFISLQPETTTPNDVDFSLNVAWWNSFNTYYEVIDHPELIIIANRYLLSSKYLTGLPEKSKNEYTDIVYVPYSKQLHLEELINAGKDYLEKSINQAFTELDTLKVKSRSFPKLGVVANISRDLIRNIITIEHIDPDSFAISDDNGKELSERVLVIIGANQDHAYRYTGSPAGASGLAQFISSTYKNMVANYPGAKLIKDYNAGMADHINAIKAMVLFFDSHEKEIVSKLSRQDMVRSLGISEEMLAATYNGGPGKVVKSVNKYGLSWLSNQLNLPQASRIFRQETINYVKKFRAIKNLNLFANISGG